MIPSFSRRTIVRKLSSCSTNRQLLQPRKLVVNTSNGESIGGGGAAAALAQRAITSHTTYRAMSSSNGNLTDDFQAWRVEETDQNQFVGSEQTLSTDSLKIRGQLYTDLEDSDDTVLIRVTYSSLNYKDALSAAGNKGVTRNYPHTPGIDAAGRIVDSGDSVLVTGYDLGMNTDGGFGEYIRVPKEWIITPNPFDKAPVTDKDIAGPSFTSMVYGTAGLTAGLCIEKLLTVGNAKPEDGPIAITGASGGVGSIAVEILAQKLGFEVVAISGSMNDSSSESKAKALIELGAAGVVERDTLAPSNKPLLKPTYAHAIDTVGGAPLAELFKRIKPGGSIAACGNAAGLLMGDSASVLPFILKGIQLLGVDSVEISLEEKQHVWNKLSNEWRCSQAEANCQVIGRNELGDSLSAMIEGSSPGVGRIVLDHDK